MVCQTMETILANLAICDKLWMCWYGDYQQVKPGD